MHDWYAKNLGDPLLVVEALDQIKNLFGTDYDKFHHPTDMAIFVRHEAQGDLHCTITLYFPPATAAVAHVVGAVKCARPSLTDLGLFAGSEDAWSVLF